jgi:hypothetical protein
MPQQEGRITSEAATALARWAGLKETLPPERLAEVFESVQEGIERLYRVDVEGFEADFLQPDSRAR